MKRASLKTRDFVLILALVLILAGSYYVQQVGIPMPPVNTHGNQEQPQGGHVPDTSTGIGLCEQGCNDFCQSHPNTPSIAWGEITPAGSAKNCKTILEEELGITDLSTCQECVCVCFTG